MRAAARELSTPAAHVEIVALLRKALSAPANGPSEGLRSRLIYAMDALPENELRIVVAFVEGLDPSIPFGRR